MTKKPVVRRRRGGDKFKHSLATVNDPDAPKRGRPRKTAEAIGPVEVREDGVVDDSQVVLSARAQKLVDEMKDEFSEFSSDLGTFTQSRAELVPKFMKAYRAYQKEAQEKGAKGHFVSFVRLLDPSVPQDREGYRAHSSYQAAEHLRSIERSWITGQAEKPKNPPVTPFNALARLVATFLPILGSNREAFWQAFVKQLHWKESQLKRLQTAAMEQHALVKLIGKTEPMPILRTGTHN